MLIQTHEQPILWLMYFFNFLDRNAMINGKLDSLSQDLKLKGTEYNTLVSILFVGYLAGQVPANMMLNRVRPSLFMAGRLSHSFFTYNTVNIRNRLYGGLVYHQLVNIPRTRFQDYAGGPFITRSYRVSCELRYASRNSG
jgi:hypothetical protein